MDPAPVITHVDRIVINDNISYSDGSATITFLYGEYASVTNAAEAVNICRSNSLATPTLDFLAVTPETTETPEPTSTPTATP